MKISEAFPSKYLKASDLKGKEYQLTMSHVEMEDLGSETKPVLYFMGAEKGLVLNKTNAEMIVLMHGDDTDSWQGHAVRIKPDKTQFNGQIRDCIRVIWQNQNERTSLPNPNNHPSAPLPQDPPAQKQSSALPAGSLNDPLDDAIPF